jgi:asparagine synthetase B (glutamine-hydrolysing)
MCGIAGIYRRGDTPIPHLNRFADALLRGIENRGRDATGYLSLDDEGAIQVEKMVVPATPFIAKRRRLRHDARTVLLHTRFATVGRRDDPVNAHPIGSGNTAAVHNGTIYNADELFKTFSMTRHAEVDSEVIPALVDLAGWGQAAKALELMDGGAATAMVNTEHRDELILARVKDYPLVYVVAEDFVVWASTEHAISGAWHHVFGRRPKKTRFKSMPEGTLLRVTPAGMTAETFEVKRLPSRWWDSTSYESRQSGSTTYVSKQYPPKPKSKSKGRGKGDPATWAPLSAAQEMERLGIPVFSEDGTTEWMPWDELRNLPEWQDGTLDVDEQLAPELDMGWCDDCGEWAPLTRKFDGDLCPECIAFAREELGMS